MMTIGEFSLVSGIGTKTLRYYDEVGLLRPARVEDKNGYRLYDDACLERAKRLLIWRECGFSLDEIKFLLDANDPGEGIIHAIDRQIGRLRERRDEIDATIRRLEEISTEFIEVRDEAGSSSLKRENEAMGPLITRLRTISDALMTVVSDLHEVVDSGEAPMDYGPR